MTTENIKNITKAILFFVKYPKLGHVKSRLSKDLDPKYVNTLYRCFVNDLHTTLKKTDVSIIICYDPKDKKKQFQQWLGNDYHYLEQKGKNLGDRLKKAFEEGFSLGYNQLLVIGSDSPDLPQKIITDSFQHLTTQDVVIGPSSDGGYYLLALKKETYSPHLFSSINWSTSMVYKETIERIKEKNQTPFILPEWHDIDTIIDLQNYYQRNQQSEFKDSETMIALKTYFSEIDNT
jgi:rSAM/selenodomain-associated transferase 1